MIDRVFQFSATNFFFISVTQQIAIAFVQFTVFAETVAAPTFVVELCSGVLETFTVLPTHRVRHRSSSRFQIFTKIAIFDFVLETTLVLGYCDFTVRPGETVRTGTGPTLVPVHTMSSVQTNVALILVRTVV